MARSSSDFVARGRQRKGESLERQKRGIQEPKHKKKEQYEEVLQVIKEELPDVDLGSLKGMPSTIILT